MYLWLVLFPRRLRLFWLLLPLKCWAFLTARRVASAAISRMKFIIFLSAVARLDSVLLLVLLGGRGTLASDLRLLDDFRAVFSVWAILLWQIKLKWYKICTWQIVLCAIADAVSPAPSVTDKETNNSTSSYGAPHTLRDVVQCWFHLQNIWFIGPSVGKLYNCWTVQLAHRRSDFTPYFEESEFFGSTCYYKKWWYWKELIHFL